MSFDRSDSFLSGGNLFYRLQKRRRRGPFRAAPGRVGGEAGQALVEFALMLVPLLLVILGIIKFGILFGEYVTLTNATGYGARTLAVSRGNGTGPPTACQAATTALDNAATTLSTSQITVSITFPSPDTSTCSALQPGDSGEVQATYPCNLQILFFNFWPNCELSSQTTVRIE